MINEKDFSKSKAGKKKVLQIPYTSCICIEAG